LIVEVDNLRAELAQRTAERDALREQLRLANIDQFNSEAEIAALKADLDLALSAEISRVRLAELAQRTAERDEARREVCELRADLRSTRTSPKEIAEDRGWDCFDAKEVER
jgi:beta-glucosidase-like glycosyl hydrolase